MVILAQCINAFSNVIHMPHVRNLKPEALVATFKQLYYLYYKYYFRLFSNGVFV